MPNVSEPFDADSFKDYITLVKEYFAESAIDLKKDLDLIKDTGDLETSLDSLKSESSELFGDNEGKNLDKLLKEAQKTAETSIASCIEYWEKIGETFLIAVEGVWGECSKISDCVIPPTIP